MSSTPIGLEHLRRQLFADCPERSAQADGLLLIEAPGEVGEVQLAARQIRAWLEDGVPASSILLTKRDLKSSLPLFKEIFAEYEIAAQWPPRSVLESGAVRLLLRALPLAAEGFPFEAVSAMWRNNYFHPNFEPDLPLKAELLLHDLHVPRGREAYLQAVQAWAQEVPPAPLEDEGMDESRRRLRSQLAKRCLGFFQWFFDLWKHWPASDPPARYLPRIRDFVHQCGMDKGAAAAFNADPFDAAALREFIQAIDAWAATQPTKPISVQQLVRKLEELAEHTLLPCAESEGIRVVEFGLPGSEHCNRILIDEPDSHSLISEHCSHLLIGEPCSHLLILGLGEGSIPRFHDAPLEQTLREEQELFRQVIALPTKMLVLSRPALDAKGQALLPSSFFESVLACFDEIPTIRQRMLIEHYFDRKAYSAAEARVQYAWALKNNQSTAHLPDVPTAAKLAAARRVAQERWRAREPIPYHGCLKQPTSMALLSKRFNEQYIFSATALERYVSCPFQFFLNKVLKLEPLEPAEDEVTAAARGTTVHRALRRYHQHQVQPRSERQATEQANKQAKETAHTPHAGHPHVGTPQACTGQVYTGQPCTAQPESERTNPRVERRAIELFENWRAAVEEEIERTHNEVGKILWQLELRRLQRALNRYLAAWDQYRANIARATGSLPEPKWLEVTFGYDNQQQTASHPPLVIQSRDGAVRIGGTVDRVDVATLPDGLGFLVIDYKTGRGTSYGAKDVQNFKKLQLPLYALAVEQILAHDGPTRPLGLIYWLLLNEGCKYMLPDGRNSSKWVNAPEAWPRYRDDLIKVVITAVRALRQGDFRLAPRDEATCRYCGYRLVCRINQHRDQLKPLPLSDD